MLRSTELGKLYNATDLLSGDVVTVKILSPVFAVDEKIVERFMGEAETLSHVAHPNVLRVIDFGSEPEGLAFIAYEPVEGVTLKDEIVVEGAFGLQRALDIAEQVAAGLVAAHSRGVMHGCLGGDKVLLTKDSAGRESVKILQLGTSTSGEAVKLSAETAVEYLSPEQCADPANFDARSDIYSLGVMIYEMLTGQVPFNGSNPGELMMKQATQPPPPLASFRKDLPDGLEFVVMNALAKNRELRFQTMDEFLAEIAAMRGAASVAAAAAGGDRNVWKSAFIVLALVSVLSTALIYLTYVKRTDPQTVAQNDPGASPVQPINPATGINEQGLASIIPMTADVLGQMNPVPPPMSEPAAGGGDGYNPWASSGPPPGAPPTIVQPGGATVTVEEGNSVFMPEDGGGVILVPKQVEPAPTPPRPAPANAARPSPTPEPDEN